MDASSAVEIPENFPAKKCLRRRKPVPRVHCWRLLKGTRHSAQDPFSVMLTEEAAQRYFPDRRTDGQVDPLQQPAGSEGHRYFPGTFKTSHIHPGMLIPSILNIRRSMAKKPANELG